MDGGSARIRARLAGLLYLVLMVAAMFAEAGMRGSLIVSGDAAATARNILSHEGLFRLGGGADLLSFLCDTALAGLLYGLLKPAGSGLALQAAIFRAVYSALAASLTFSLFVVPSILHGAGLGAFTLPQIQALALVMIKVHSAGYNVALVFFGIHIVLIGALIVRAPYLPAWLGWLLGVAGVCYLVNSGLNLLAPRYSLYPFILLPGLVAEGALMLWLLIVGVSTAKWPAGPAPQVEHPVGA